jgi:hypothetical protein
MSAFPASFISDLELAMGVDMTPRHTIRVDHGSGISKGAIEHFFPECPPGYDADDGARAAAVINARPVYKRGANGDSHAMTPFTIRMDERGKAEVVIPLDLPPDIAGRARTSAREEARRIETLARLQKKLAARRAAGK